MLVAVRGRNEQLIRLLSIIRSLHRSGGSDIYELANQHGTTTRTIRRDLAALDAARLPLRQTADGRRMRWHIEYRDALEQVAKVIDASHYVAVMAALGTGGLVTRHASARVALEDLATKLARSLTPAERGRLGRLGEAFGSPRRDILEGTAPDVLGPLLVAISDRKLCTIHYTSIKRRRSRLEVLPLRLRSQPHGLYLLGYLPRRDDLVTLALDRIKSLQPTERTVRVPEHIDVDRYVESLFGIDGSGEETTFRLRFSSRVAPYIRARSWHPTQRLRRRKDGGVELTFTCRESVEVSAWIASWREHVEVIAPETMRHELAQLAARYKKLYDLIEHRR